MNVQTTYTPESVKKLFGFVIGGTSSLTTGQGALVKSLAENAQGDALAIFEAYRPEAAQPIVNTIVGNFMTCYGQILSGWASGHVGQA